MTTQARLPMHLPVPMKMDEADITKETNVTDTPPTIDPKQTVLLVMDYMPAALGYFAETDELLAHVTEAIAIVREHGALVGNVRVAFDEDDFAAIPATNKAFAPLASSGFLQYEPAGHAFHDRVVPEPGDIIVCKNRVGAFSTTDLNEQLKDRGITNIILAGIHTSGVVLSTVRDASDRDYRLFVLADASADPDREVHDMLMEKVFPRQAHVITVAELPGLFLPK
jgi:nicotinamidase-related amidase